MALVAEGSRGMANRVCVTLGEQVPAATASVLIDHFLSQLSSAWEVVMRIPFRFIAAPVDEGSGKISIEL